MEVLPWNEGEKELLERIGDPGECEIMKRKIRVSIVNAWLTESNARKKCRKIAVKTNYLVWQGQIGDFDEWRDGDENKLQLIMMIGKWK